MDLRLTEEQEQLVAAWSAVLAKHATPDHVRAAEPLGHDRNLWGRVSVLGAIPMAVSEASGGWGASLLDLELIAEQLGRAVAPVPVIEAQIAARLLARIDSDEGRTALAAALAGDVLVTATLHPAVEGVARLAPGAAVAGAVVVLVDDELRLVELDAPQASIDNLGSMPVADVAVPDGAPVLAAGAAALDAHRIAVAEWMTLMGGALTGIAGRAVELGVDYAKERHAWGVPIGSFQAISHPLADAATATDAAQLVARKAAWAAAEDPVRFAELAGMAFGLASEAARTATYCSLHTHGGYGFMMEFDIQLYFRRARAWSNVLGEPAVAYRRVADARYGIVR